MAKGLAGVFSKMDIWQMMVNAGLQGLGNMYAQRVSAYGKEKAKWQPVRIPKHKEPFTGHARQGLFASVYWQNKKLMVAYSHSVDYGIYLELSSKFKGKYKILEEAVQFDKAGYFTAAGMILRR